MARLALTRFRLKRLAIAATVCVTLSACGSSSADVALEQELAEFEATLMAHEVAIAGCMTDLAFRYVPHLPGDWLIEKASAPDEAAGGSGRVDIEVPPNPNEVHLASLSESEREAYEFAYWGDLDRGGLIPGCFASTHEEVWGRSVFEPLGGGADEARASIAVDPRVVGARELYVDCMEAAGYRVGDTESIYRIIDEHAQSAQQDEQISFHNEALAAHEQCRRPYDEVYEEVKAEYLDQVFPNE